MKNNINRIKNKFSDENIQINGYKRIQVANAR